jgi:hypothetical protein
MGLHCPRVNMTNAWEVRYLCHARSLGIRAHHHLKQQQRTYYVAAEYIDHNDRLLVEEGDTIELYSLDLRLAQHWYPQAWGGERLNLRPFKAQRLDWDMEPE